MTESSGNARLRDCFSSPRLSQFPSVVAHPNGSRKELRRHRIRRSLTAKVTINQSDFIFRKADLRDFLAGPQVADSS